GLAAAFVFGLLFVRGSLRVDLARFFKITGIALLIFVAQLLIDGYHELAEAGWLPANQASMAAIGPLVKNEFFFIVAVLALPLLMLLVPGSAARPAAPPVAGTVAQPAPSTTGAAVRLERATAQQQARARVWGGSLGVAILAALGLGFVYSRPPAALSPAIAVQVGADGLVRLPVAGFQGSTALRRYVVTIAGRGGRGETGTVVRFIAVPLDDPRQASTRIATAFDACEICGPKGYYQEGGNITCLHCGSAIYPPSIGQRGGCNPIPLPSRRAGDELLLRAADLAAGVPLFGGPPGAAAPHHAM
ncbi:MAG TPA: Fe-S-containing protein, partial [Thermoanaerobaculia bacterium]|nr:Fe-S-containing protein [Thermoanaerobaculia bacterium]